MAACSSDITIIADPAYTLLLAIETMNMLGHRNLHLEVAEPPGRSTMVFALEQCQLIFVSLAWFGAYQRSTGC